MLTSGITYETALALKNAGFPQNTLSDGHNCPYCPSFSELIEACGYDFKMLKKTTFTSCEDSSLRLSVDDPNIAFVAIAIFEEIQGWGLSAEEAVANLWLKLKENE